VKNEKSEANEILVIGPRKRSIQGCRASFCLLASKLNSPQPPPAKIDFHCDFFALDFFLSDINTCQSNYVLTDFDNKCATKHPMISWPVHSCPGYNRLQLFPPAAFQI